MDATQRDVELRVLSAARTPEVLKDAIHALGPYSFTDSALEWVWVQFKGFSAHNEKPNSPAMVAQAAAEPEEVREPLISAILEVWKAHASESPTTDCLTLRQFHVHDYLTSTVQRVTKTMIRGDIDGARDILARGAREIPGANGVHLRPSGLADWDDWAKTPDQIQGIPTGFQRIDDEWAGVVAPELVMIFGTTGMGKSILAVNLGFAALKHGYPVLHCDSENGESLVRWRYVSRMTGASLKGLERRWVQHKDPTLKIWMQRNATRLDAKLKILHFGYQRTKLDELKESAATLAREGFKPAVIILDSPDHLNEPSTENSAHDAKLLWERIAGWGQETRAALYVVTQAKPEAIGRIATEKDVAWGNVKIQTATAAFSINPPQTRTGGKIAIDDWDGRRTIYVCKGRTGSSRFSIPLQSKLDAATFLDSKWPSSDDAEDEDV